MLIQCLSDLDAPSEIPRGSLLFGSSVPGMVLTHPGSVLPDRIREIAAAEDQRIGKLIEQDNRHPCLWNRAGDQQVPTDGQLLGYQSKPLKIGFCV
jgi:hypothetical protein